MHQESLPPILCAHLLRRVDESLIELLLSLHADEWSIPTVSPQWKVLDVAAHLLDTPLRKLSMVRDSWLVERAEIQSNQDLTDLINRLNREGVTVYRRLSPSLLIQCMKTACEESADFHESLDPFARAAFAVSWAGEEESLNWFDTARELTERWHHQEQIRLATNRPTLMLPELYYPVLDCFLRGLPHAFRDVSAQSGTLVQVEVVGDCGGCWYLLKQADRWLLVKHTNIDPKSRITIPQELAWRIFTKGVDRDTARSAVRIEGDRTLGERVIQLTAIVG